MHSKDYKKPIYYFRRVLADKNIKINNPYIYAVALRNLAYSQYLSNDYTNLPLLFFTSLKISKTIDDKENIIANTANLSEYYAKIKDTTNSLLFAKKTLGIAKKSKISVYILFALKQIALVDKKNSPTHFANYIRINDSLQDVERINRNIFAKIEL